MARTLVDGIEYQDYREIHVDPIIGVDDISAKSGDENSRFATVSYTLSLFTLNVADNTYYTSYTADSNIKINILVTGVISDSPTVTYNDVTIQANKATRNRHNSLTAITHNSTGTLVVNGIKLTDFTKQNSGTTYLENLQITGNISITGTGTVEFRNCDLKGATCTITGASTVKFIGGTSPTISSSVAGTNIYLINTYDGGTVNISNGSYSIENANFTTSGSSLAGTILTTYSSFDNISIRNVPTVTGRTQFVTRNSDGTLSVQTVLPINLNNDVISTLSLGNGGTGSATYPDNFAVPYVFGSGYSYTTPTSTPKFLRASTSGIDWVNVNQLYVVTVGLSNADYTTLSAAVAAITDSSSTKRYIIAVGNGTFTVDNVSLVGKPYVSIIGNGINNTVFVPSGATVDGLSLGTNNDIRNVEFQNYGSGKYALKTLDSSRININNLRFINCDGNINAVASGAISYVSISNIWIAGSFSYGISCSGTGSNILNIDIKDVIVDGGSTGAWYGIYTAPGAVVSCNNVNITKGQGTGSAYYINAYPTLTATGGTLTNCNYAFNFGLNNGACDVTGTGIIVKGATIPFYNQYNSNLSKGFFQLTCDDYYAYTDVSSKIRGLIIARNDVWFLGGNLYNNNPKAYGSSVASNEYVTLGYINAQLNDYQNTCRAVLTSNQALSNTADNTINFTADYDPGGRFNNTAHSYDCPKAGNYRIDICMYMAPAGTGGSLNFQPRVNGISKWLYADFLTGISKTYCCSYTLTGLTAGDDITVTGWSADNGQNVSNATNGGVYLTYVQFTYLGY